MTNNSVCLGKHVTDFSALATSGLNLKLSDYLGKFVVIYFYPKDSTPGCTLEGQDFRDNHQEFKELNSEIFGISRDSLKSHENFKCKQNFPFELISDSNETICKLFDVIKTKNMYGKTVQGIERSTFLIGKDGNLEAEWRKVTVKGHVDCVLQKIRELSAKS